MIGGDAHAAPRRSAVVHVREDYVKTLGRSSTARHEPPSTLASEPDPACKLDKKGVFSLRWQHSVPRSHFSNPKLCHYYGHLQPDAEAALRAFWEAAIYG